MRAATACGGALLLLLWTAVSCSLTIGFVFSRLSRPTRRGGGAQQLRRPAAAAAAERLQRSAVLSAAAPSAPVVSPTTVPLTTPLLTCATSSTPECVPAAEIAREWGVPGGQYSREKCCAYHGEFRLMMREMEYFLRMQAVPYFVGGGALIGFLRHGGRLVPWDTDLDFYVPTSPNARARTAVHQTETFAKLSAWDSVMPGSRYALRPCAFQNGACITSWKLHRRADRFKDRLNVEGPRFDLFMLQKDEEGDGLLHVANRYWWDLWAVPPALVFPLKPCRLYGTRQYCPARPREYVQLVYGENVLSRADGNADFWAVKSKAGDGPQKSMMQRVKARYGTAEAGAGRRKKTSAAASVSSR
jgi:hypothetical protein